MPGHSGDTVQATAQRERTTEVEALRPRASQPAYQAWLCLRLARIASQPSAYPDVNDKPAVAQGGERLLVWVGSRVGLQPEQVEAYLKQVDDFFLSES